MKLRTIALAGVAVAALSSPASAGTGWYLGLGAGWSQLDPVNYTHASPAYNVTKAHDSSAVFAGSFGYKFEGGFRLENEIAYSSHNLKTSSGSTGSTQLKTDMINLVADIPIMDNWSLSIGAGLGAGAVRENVLNGPLTLANGEKVGLAWQAIAGLTIPISSQIDLFADYRYRNVELNSGYATSYINYAPMVVRGAHEQNVMFGLRWYFEPPAPPPPPPPPPPPLRHRHRHRRLRRRLRRR